MKLREVAEITGTQFYDWLDREADVPVVRDLPVSQGDVFIEPVTDGTEATAAMTKSVALVESEVTGHTHRLHGKVKYDRRTSSDGLLLGVVTVPNGCEALVDHEEHGAFTLSPGTYEISRQRDFAGEWAYVAD